MHIKIIKNCNIQNFKTKGKIIMNSNSEILINKFKEIAKKRWIPSVNNNSNGVGLTF